MDSMFLTSDLHRVSIFLFVTKLYYILLNLYFVISIFPGIGIGCY